MKALEPAQIVRLHGQDAIAFAQTQFSGDVGTLAVATWQWNAWLDPQGRVRHFFALLRTANEQLLAWLPLGDADAMCKELGKYRFRASLELRSVPDWTLYQGADEVDPATGALAEYAEGHALALPGSSRRLAILAPRGARPFDAGALAAWRQADIEAGLPWIAPSVSGEFVPQSLGLQGLGAISLEKGCYPGQEIVARLHYRGGNKRSLYRVQTHAREAPVAGMAILDRGTTKSAGRILYGAASPSGTHRALAVLPHDRDDSEDSKNSEWMLENGVMLASCIPIRAQRPPERS